MMRLARSLFFLGHRLDTSSSFFVVLFRLCHRLGWKPRYLHPFRSQALYEAVLSPWYCTLPACGGLYLAFLVAASSSRRFNGLPFFVFPPTCRLRRHPLNLFSQSAEILEASDWNRELVMLLLALCFLFFGIQIDDCPVDGMVLLVRRLHCFNC